MADDTELYRTEHRAQILIRSAEAEALDSLDRTQRRRDLRQVIQVLDDEQWFVVFGCFWGGETEPGIAADLGISVNRVHRIKLTALAKLRRELSTIHVRAAAA